MMKLRHAFVALASLIFLTKAAPMDPLRQSKTHAFDLNASPQPSIHSQHGSPREAVEATAESGFNYAAVYPPNQGTLYSDPSTWGHSMQHTIPYGSSPYQYVQQYQPNYSYDAYVFGTHPYPYYPSRATNGQLEQGQSSRQVNREDTEPAPTLSAQSLPNANIHGRSVILGDHIGPDDLVWAGLDTSIKKYVFKRVFPEKNESQYDNFGKTAKTRVTRAIFENVMWGDPLEFASAVKALRKGTGGPQKETVRSADDDDVVKPYIDRISKKRRFRLHRIIREWVVTYVNRKVRDTARAVMTQEMAAELESGDEERIRAALEQANELIEDCPTLDKFDIRPRGLAMEDNPQFVFPADLTNVPEDDVRLIWSRLANQTQLELLDVMEDYRHRKVDSNRRLALATMTLSLAKQILFKDDKVVRSAIETLEHRRAFRRGPWAEGLTPIQEQLLIERLQSVTAFSEKVTYDMLNDSDATPDQVQAVFVAQDDDRLVLKVVHKWIRAINEGEDE
jgi:hypothetical protein